MDYHNEGYGDRDFLELVYPKMVSLMGFCNGRREEHGFLIGKEKDWVYIDWADMDKDGPLCAEQMLYAACFRVMAEISEQLGKDGNVYRQEYEKLTAAIEKITVAPSVQCSGLEYSGSQCERPSFDCTNIIVVGSIYAANCAS